MLGRIKKLTALLLIILIFCSSSINAYSAEVPDLTRKGTIRITMQFKSRPVPYGKILLYHVADVALKDADYSLVPTSSFQGSNLKLDDVQSPQLASSLSDYAANNNIEGLEKEIDINGYIEFSDLKLGLYLIVQSEAAKGYSKVQPFLVSIPMLQDEEYVYQIDASPKLELKMESDVEPLDESRSEESEEDNAADDFDEDNAAEETKLPKTGTLNWPIPILAVSGIALFIIGWAIKYNKRKKDNEE